MTTKTGWSLRARLLAMIAGATIVIAIVAALWYVDKREADQWDREKMLEVMGVSSIEEYLERELEKPLAQERERARHTQEMNDKLEQQRAHGREVARLEKMINESAKKLEYEIPTVPARPESSPTFGPLDTPTPAFTATMVPTTLPHPTPTLTPRPTITPAPSFTATILPTTLPHPTATPRPTATPSPSPTPTLTPRPTATPSPSPTPTLTPRPTATPSPLPTLALPPHQRNLKAKQYMLTLINQRRAEHDVDPVVLGDNIAAQLHTEASLAGCFNSHWGADGLKPHMRYTLAGGYQGNAENGSGFDYCHTEADYASPIRNIERYVRVVMTGMMNSPGHRKSILDPLYKKVSIGIARSKYNVMIAQHFEGDYLEYTQVPTITGGSLSLAGTVHNEATLPPINAQRGLAIAIHYDPPPYGLTRGQLSRTYCYDYGVRVAAIRMPLGANRHYPSDEFSYDYSPCPDPHDVPADAPPPATAEESREFWAEAKAKSAARRSILTVAQWVTASLWTVEPDRFKVTADITDILAVHGPGVYTVLVWGTLDGEMEIISTYSVFHEVAVGRRQTARLSLAVNYCM